MDARKKKFRRGFTLAEVLITLVIIGVIAALTVPTLLQNKEKQETITGLKEANAILSSAVSLAKLDYGDISTWDYTLYSDAFAERYITPYLKIGKICGATSGGPALATGCFSGPDDSWYDLGGNLLNEGNGYGRPNSYTFLLQNGMGVGVWRNVPGTNFSVIFVDVNGGKGPTKVGKDVFVFTVAKCCGFSIGEANEGDYNQLRATRSDLLSASFYGSCNKNTPGNGSLFVGGACGLVILRDGWEIKDDYPWD